jgi:hypothetical protein
MPQWHKAETFEDYLAAKRIDSAAWQAARPEEYAEIQQLFATLGPRNFDQQKKFQINEWRLAFPALKPSDRQPPPKDSGQEKTTEQQA